MASSFSPLLDQLTCMFVRWSGQTAGEASRKLLQQSHKPEAALSGGPKGFSAGEPELAVACHVLRRPINVYQQVLCLLSSSLGHPHATYTLASTLMPKFAGLLSS